MSYKVEKAGYEFRGYKLGEKVMYRGEETMIIGFDENEKVSGAFLAISITSGNEITHNAYLTSVLDTAKNKCIKFRWVSELIVTPIQESEKPMEKKMTKEDLEGKWVKVVKGDGRHFHANDLIQIKNGGIRAIDGGDTLRYWYDVLAESFSEKELRDELLNRYSWLKIEYLGDYPQSQSKPKSDSPNSNKKSDKTNLTVKLNVDMLFDSPVVEETKEEVYIFSGRTTAYFNKDLGIYGISTCDSKELPSYNKEIGMSLAYRRAYLSLNNK